MRNEPGERVLVAEDEDNIRFLVGRQLQKAGYEVGLAADGGDAIAMLEQEEFGVIVSDIRMPGADGLQIMRVANGLWPDTEVIVLTGFGTAENILEAVRAGNLFDYLTKPLNDIREVSVVVERACERRRMRRENSRLRSELDRAAESLALNTHRMMHAGKLATVGHLAQTVAQGINTPLESVVDLASYLTDKLGLLTSGDMAEVERERLFHALSRVGDAARQCRDVVDTLVRYSRPDNGEFRELDVNQVLHDTLVLTEPEIVQAGIALETSLDPEIPPTFGSQTRLVQAFTSLLLNASQATPPGGTISVSTAKHDGKPPNVEVTIADTGCGMPREQLERVFDRDHVEGIGLRVSREIVEAHHGQMAITSEVGMGTQVSLTIPGIGQERRPVSSPRAA